MRKVDYAVRGVGTDEITFVPRSDRAKQRTAEKIVFKDREPALEYMRAAEAEGYIFLNARSLDETRDLVPKPFPFTWDVEKLFSESDVENLLRKSGRDLTDMSGICGSGYHKWDMEHRKLHTSWRCLTCGVTYDRCTECGNNSNTLRTFILRSPSGERQAVLCDECYDKMLKTLYG